MEFMFNKYKYGLQSSVRIDGGGRGLCYAGNVMEVEGKMTSNGSSRPAGSLEDHF